MNHAIIFNVHVLGIRRPSGPHRIASFLREHDWDVEVIDYTTLFSDEGLKEVARMRITSNTVFLGFSTFFSYWDDKITNFVAWLKITYPHVKIVIGGQSKARIDDKNIDYHVHGYGENAILALAKSFIGNGSSIKLDPAYLGKAKVISANTFYPSFPMKSLRIKYEDRDYLQPWEWLTTEFARGCKFKCPYCNFPILGVKGDYSRDAEDFEIELKENYERWGISNYYVADETFNDRTEKIEKFASVVDKTNINPVFSGFIRADLLVSRRQDWDLLRRLGFYGHFYGIESFNPATGKAIGKGMDPKKLQEGLIEAKNYFKSYGPYRGSIGIVIGLPHETIESQRATFDWLANNWQGEAAHFWPLEIPLDSKRDVLSTLSERWAEYGYRESLKEIVEGPEFLKHININAARVGMGSSNLNWENDNMSLSDACMLSNEFYTKIYSREVKFNIGMFTYCDYLVGGKMSFDQALSLHAADFPVEQTWAYEKAYIEKKLK